MKKRFTDADKWQGWFRTLKPIYKCLWFYLNDECDFSGVWKVDKSLAEFKIGHKINWEEAINILDGRIYIFDNGEKWLINKFIEFQYGKCLKSSWSAHKGIIRELNRHGIANLLLDSELNILQIDSNSYDTVHSTVQDKDMDKDKDKDKDKEGGVGETIKEPNYVLELMPNVEHVVYLTKKQYEKLVAKYNETETNKMIIKMECWCQSRIKNRYDNYYMALVNWLLRDKEKD